MTDHHPHLKRAIGPYLLSLYGVGVTIGAGIYVLVGEVVAVAGMAAPVAFLLAGVLAGLSALSYAELGTRYPMAGGEATYVDAAFGTAGATTAVGLLVAFSGITSSAAVLLGFVGYLNELVAVPGWMALVGIVGLLALITFWGVAESMRIVAVTTAIEVGGLVLVIGAAAPSLAEFPASLPDMWPGLDSVVWLAVISSSVLAFFAFIGFEDIVNMAEEVRRPHRNLPIAILVTLVVSTLLYITLTVVSILSVGTEALGASDAPLALVFSAGGGNPDILSSIAILAVVNGALIQMIMASRLLYGMANLGRLPRWLAHVNERTRTPDHSILCTGAIILVFALLLPIETLASYASLAVMLVFASVNIALLVLRRRHARAAVEGGSVGFRVPLVVPLLGVLASLALFVFGVAERLGLISPV
jgi:amino acid transporter